MKQFNLEEYLKNPERKIVTRDGKDVRIICTDVKRSSYPVLALVDNGCYESSVFYTKNGEYFLGEENSSDLFFATKKHEGWINLYQGTLGIVYTGAVHHSEEEAKKQTDEIGCYLTTIKIEWKE